MVTSIVHATRVNGLDGFVKRPLDPGPVFLILVGSVIDHIAQRFGRNVGDEYEMLDIASFLLWGVEGDSLWWHQGADVFLEVSQTARRMLAAGGLEFLQGGDLGLGSYAGI